MGTAANGGYVLAIVGRALASDLAHADPVSMSAMYLAPVERGDVEISIEILRSSKSMTHALARLSQGGVCKLQVNAIYGELDNLEGETSLLSARPHLPDIADCVLLPGRKVEFRSQIDLYVPPGAELTREGTGDNACIDGWIAYPDGADFDLFGLLLVVDSCPPPVMKLVGLLPWVPTLDLNVQLRANPAPGPLQFQQKSRFLTHGLIEADGEVWDRKGALVAISRQLMKVRIPKR